MPFVTKIDNGDNRQNQEMINLSNAEQNLKQYCLEMALSKPIYKVIRKQNTNQQKSYTVRLTINNLQLFAEDEAISKRLARSKTACIMLDYLRMFTGIIIKMHFNIQPDYQWWWSPSSVDMENIEDYKQQLLSVSIILKRWFTEHNLKFFSIDMDHKREHIDKLLNAPDTLLKMVQDDDDDLPVYENVETFVNDNFRKYYKVELSVYDRQFYGVAISKRLARCHAAMKAIDYIENEANSDPPPEYQEKVSSDHSSEASSDEEPNDQKNDHHSSCASTTASQETYHE